MISSTRSKAAAGRAAIRARCPERFWGCDVLNKTIPAQARTHPGIGSDGSYLKRQTRIQINPIRVVLFDQLPFPRAPPFLDLLFAFESGGVSFMSLKPD